jgi:hypothetical protein
VRAGHAGRAGLLGVCRRRRRGAWLLGILAPVAAAVVWGTFVAPRAKLPVPAPVRVGIELVLYAAAAAGLAAAGQPVAAVVLGLAGLVTSLLNEVQERQAGPDVRRR